MKLYSLRTRILASAVLTALLALVMVRFTVEALIDRWRTPHDPEVPLALASACAADPAGWADARIGFLRVRAFDAAGRPVAPDGEPLSPEDLAIGVGEFRRSGDWPALRDLHRIAEGGPCAFVVVSAGPSAEIDVLLPRAFTVAAFVAVLAVSGATYLLTVRPMLRRIERIGRAAVDVGHGPYSSANDDVGDALADISSVLDRSHARILGDRDELVRRHEALERYMAEIAHDLRTPIHSLLLALQEVEAAAPGEGRTPVRRALQDADYVGTLVENLHHAARLRHGLDAAEGEVDLREVVLRLEVRFRALAAPGGVEVAAAVPDDPVIVRCNPALAERAVANLVQNAVAHAAGHVALVLESREGRFDLAVLDDGAGLPPQDLADLSLRTFTADPARGRGPGLGLAIVGEVARRVGWKFEASPADGGGLRMGLSGPTTLVQPALVP